MALAPRFDETAARRAFSPAAGAPQDAAWQALRGYSFVRDTDAPGWWTLHVRMRGALSDHSSAPDDHRFWVDSWRGRSGSETDAFAALAWYHHYCLMPAQARDEWVALTERLRGERRMAEYYALLSWWEPLDLLTEPPRTPDVGASLVALGIEHVEASLGDRAKNLDKAIACYQAALRVYTETDFPEQWAMTQNNLGIAYWDLSAGDRGANLDKAIACFENALRVYTETNFPRQWATIQYNLGYAYSNLSASDWDANPCQAAIACFEAAERGFQLAGMLDAAANAKRQADALR